MRSDVGAYESGKIDEARLHEIECNACPGGGSCSGMFTANSMNTLCEAMGVALEGNGTILASTKEREELLHKAARRIVEIVLDSSKTEQFRFRNVFNEKAVHNAFIVDMEMGGSTNTVLHMLAIAKEAEVSFSLESINEIAKKVTHIAKITPTLSSVHMEDINRAGGISAVMNEVAKREAVKKNLSLRAQGAESKDSILHLDALTITSKTLGERIKNAQIPESRREKWQKENVAQKIMQGKNVNSKWLNVILYLSQILQMEQC